MDSVIDIEDLERRARIVEAAKKLTWLPVSVAAVYGNMSMSKMWKLIKNAELTHSRDDGQVIVNRNSIDEYWELRKVSLN